MFAHPPKMHLRPFQNPNGLLKSTAGLREEDGHCLVIPQDKRASQ